jgi:hypothetical protein
MPEVIRGSEKLAMNQNPGACATIGRASGTRTGEVTSGCIDHLVSLAADGLMPMFDPQHQLFCFRRRETAEQKIVVENLSHRYTMMVLLGLRQLEESGGRAPISCSSVVTSLLRDRRCVRSGADVGLILWLTARIAPNQLEEICPTLELENVIYRYRDMRIGKTMELAWLLSGLAHAAIADPARDWKYARIAKQVYQLLVENQGMHGIFGHQATSRSLRGLIRGRIGSFADQIYPIYALSRFAKAYAEDEAVQCATRCAEAICKAQGPLGQWWWHYDALTGMVAQRYPVYSVHQDGMAPLGLFALSEVSGQNFEAAIFKGLNWIFAANELKHNMADRDNLMIWRAIAPHGTETTGAAEVLACLVGGEGRTPKNLAVVRECRPYHFGWLLYALCSRHARI